MDTCREEEITVIQVGDMITLNDKGIAYMKREWGILVNTEEEFKVERVRVEESGILYRITSGDIDICLFEDEVQKVDSNTWIPITNRLKGI